MVPWRNIGRFFDKACRQPFYAANVARKRTAAYLAYRFAKGKSAPPEAITLFLTRLCNLRCRMCGQWGDCGTSKTRAPEELKDFLPLNTVERILDEVRPYRPSITLFGGEPLIHPNAMEIMRCVKGRGFHGLIITNGVLLNHFAEGLVDAGWDELNISIDGDRELHDSIRGLQGVFDKIMAGIDEVNRLKEKKSAKKPFINLQCTISRDNCGRLEVLLDVARRSKANALTFHNLIFLTKGLMEQQKALDAELGCSSKEWEGFVFEPGIDPERLFEKMHKILSAKHDFAVDFYPNFSEKGMQEYYRNPDYLPSEYAPRCASPWICAYVFPDAEVRPCLNNTYTFGNVNRAGFLGVWNSREAVVFRRKLKGCGIFPACRRCTELFRY